MAQPVVFPHVCHWYCVPPQHAFLCLAAPEATALSLDPFIRAAFHTLGWHAETLAPAYEADAVTLYDEARRRQCLESKTHTVAWLVRATVCDGDDPYVPQEQQS